MDPDEIEFIGEKESISIVPTFNEREINLITGDVGPFIAGLPVNVPLWMAINLKTQQKCKICCPDWMNINTLEELKKEETDSKLFQKMPSEHYMVIAKLILGAASDDIPQADEVRTLIKDIWDIRMSKIRSSMDQVIKSDSFSISLPNLTYMEINSIRPILPHCLDQIYRMKSSESRSSQSLGTTTYSYSRTPSSFNQH